MNILSSFFVLLSSFFFVIRTKQPAVLKIVATWPGRWETDRAFSLGCKADKDILDVVKQYKVMLDQGQG